MNCAACSVQFNDGAECGVCKKCFDFGCANISEAGYRKLGADRRAAWKCPSCRLASPTPASMKVITAGQGHDSALEAIMQKLNAMALQLEPLPGMIKDVKGIKANIAKLQSSYLETTKKIEEFTSRVEKIEERVTLVESSVLVTKEINDKLGSLQRNDLNRDQWSRLNNIEIKGVPTKKNENLFDLIERIGNCIKYKVSKNQINYISRIPSFNNKDKSIIVSFLNRYVKEDFIASARLLKSLDASEIGFTDVSQRVFINDHLSPDYKKILTKVKQLAKEKGFQYVWVKYSKIHVRRNDTSHVITINSEFDLNKLV